jgi:hypothetical protein
VPKVPTWAEIYPSITRYPLVLQALLAPAPQPDDYYGALVAAARQAGLDDPQVIMGLLWHAPLGDSSHLAQRWEYFQRLVSGDIDGEQEKYLPEQRPLWERSRPSSQGWGEAREATAPRANNGGQSKAAGFDSDPPLEPPLPAASPRREESRRSNGNGRFRPPEGEEFFDSWSELFKLSRDQLVVDRRRYEAMIYELGKLGAWQEFFKGQQRENKNLRQKIESQWAKELEFFRQMSSKNDKKGWRKW